MRVFATEKGSFAVTVLAVNAVHRGLFHRGDRGCFTEAVVKKVSDRWFRESPRLQSSEISKNPLLIPEHREKVEAVPANGSVFAHHHDARFTVKE